MNPKVSVCIPSYNGGKFIRECIAAVQNQSFYEFEIIIVDDQSSDDCYEIAKEIAYHDDRIQVYRNEKNLGLVGNWNKCLEYTSTQWIKYVFQDDMIMPECIENLYSNCLVHNKKVGICNRRYVIDAGADPDVKNYILNDLIKLDKYCHLDHVFSKKDIAHIVSRHPLLNIFGEPTSVLFHKSLIEKIGTFNEDLSQVVDYDFMVKICAQDGCYFSLKPLNFFRIHSENQTNKNRGSERNEEKKNKIEYIDALIMLHSFLYDAHYETLVSKEEHKNIITEKYNAELAKGVDQLGTDKMKSLINTHAANYKNLVKDLSSIHATMMN